MNVSAKLVRNSAFSAAGRLWTAATTFVIMPYMLHVLGQDTYGVLRLLFLLLGYFSYADLGISSALAKFVSEYAAREEHEMLARVTNTGIAFYMVVGLGGTLIAAFLARPYLHLIKTPAGLMSEAYVSYYWLLMVTGFTMIVTAFRGILTGLHRIDLINAVEVVISIPILIATVWVLWAGYGLVGMAIVQWAQYMSIGALLIYYTVRLMPQVRVNPFRASWSTFVQLIQYGWKTAVSSSAMMVQGQAENLYLASMLGPGTVGLYTFGAKVVDVWRSTFFPAFSAVVPAASHMGAVGDTEKVRVLYERGTKITMAILQPMSWWLIAITPIFITAWMGAGYGTAMVSMRLLMLSMALFLAGGVCTSVARGLGCLQPELYACAAMAAAELILGWFLGKAFGLVGILSASIVAFSVCTAVSVVLIHRSFRWPLLPVLFKVYLPPILMSVIAFLPVYYYNHLHRHEIVHMGALSGRVLRMAPIGIAETLAYASIYWLLLKVTRYLTPEDLDSLKKAARGARSTQEEEPVAVAAS